jgi:hypothetical protein
MSTWRKNSLRRSRKTDDGGVKRFGWAALVLLSLVITSMSGCVRTGDGVAVRGEDFAATGSPQRPTEDAGGAASPGVVASTVAPIPPNSVVCPDPVEPAVTAVAKVADPAAPTVTVVVPDGWSGKPGSGDVGTRLEGPDGMSATVTIVRSALDPVKAFTAYADKVMAVSTVSSVSVLPAELCGYSGQKLMGTWSDTPQQSVEFLDRIAHIPTSVGNYVIAIHVQAPAGTNGFDAASATLISDVGVRIP